MARVLRILRIAALLTCATACSEREEVLVVNSAPHLDGELAFRGADEQVTIAPGGRIWMVSGAGEIVAGEGLAVPWARYGLGSLRSRIEASAADLSKVDLGPSLYELSFFTPDTAIALGIAIWPGEPGSEHGLLRTADGGVTWDTVPYGDTELVHGAFTTADGRAWIGTMQGRLLHSTDYGATWMAVAKPMRSRISAIHFNEDGVGLVGGLWNELALTRDGGRTWDTIPTPFEEGLIREDSSRTSHMLRGVAVAGKYLVVEQGRQVFRSRIAHIAWQAIPRATHFSYDTSTEAIYVIESDLRLAKYDRRLRRELLAGGQRLNHWPDRITAREGLVVARDTEGGLYMVRNDRLEYGFPLSTSERPDFITVRGYGDRLWAVTQHQIYTSTDGGEFWDRVGFSPTGVRSFLVLPDDRLLLWDGHGGNRVFDLASGTLRPLQSLRGFDVVGIHVLGEHWVAFGGRQYETAGRVEVGRYFYPGEFAGSRHNGFVLVSDDAGQTWDLVDEWPEGGVANVFVDIATHDMVLVSYLGGVRTLRRTRKGYEAENLILPTEETWKEVPYVEQVSVVFFEDANRGFIDGWIHHLGERKHTTSDGGRTWHESTEPRHFIRAFPTSAGYLVVQGSEWQGGVEVLLLRGNVQRSIWKVDRPQTSPGALPKPVITDVSVDDQGRILAVLDGERVQVVGALSGAVMPRPHQERR